MRGILPVFLIAALCAAHATSATAAAQRTFVKSDGLDTNACTIPAPCRSFGKAITQTNDGGEIVVLDSAGYGPVAITKSVSIIAPRGIYAGVTVFGGGDGVTVATAGIDVILQGLTINGLGGARGIAFLAGNSLLIEDCVISGMGSVGILLSGSNTQSSVRNTIARDNAGGGIRLASITTGTVTAVLDAVTSEQNGGNGLESGSGARLRVRGGSYSYNSGAGVALLATLSNTAGAAVSITDARIMSNGAQGVRLFPGASNPAQIEALIADCEIASNLGDGVSVITGAVTGWNIRATLARNRIFRNTGNGVFTQEPAASVLVILVGNTITRNTDAGMRNDIANPAGVTSSQDNMVDKNDGPETAGTIGTFVGT
ncbi:MAG: right-handed parallel beta-helix repeat-containing protein [Casimicrobiaceae bacterium]